MDAASFLGERKRGMENMGEVFRARLFRESILPHLGVLERRNLYNAGGWLRRAVADQRAEFAAWQASPERGLKAAALAGSRTYVEYFVSLGARNWNWGLQSAALGGHLHLVLFFIDKGASDWNGGLEGAARGGHRDLVLFFIGKGASDWNGGLEGAARGGHLDLVLFFNLPRCLQLELGPGERGARRPP